MSPDAPTDPGRAIASARIVGIARKLPPGAVVDIVGAAINEGIEVVEVTLDSDEALDQVRRLSATFPDVLVGAGSVLDRAGVAAAADAGARFVVSPIVDEGVIEASIERRLGVFPGAATPTEIVRALRAGATAVKVFPIAQLGGASYLRAVMSPLGSPPLIPTGGVTADTAPGLLAAGAAAVGAGSSLFSTSAFEAGGLAEISRRAARWVEAVQ